MSMAHLGPSFDIHTGGDRPGLPASRGRDRPERGGDRPALRPDLAALRPPADGGREDGQVDRQHRPGRRPARRGHLAAGAALRPHLGPLPQAARLQRGLARGRGRRDRAARRPRRGAALRTARTARTIPELPAVLAGARDAFDAALDDDLNVSAGLAALFDLVRELNRRIDARSLSTADAASPSRRSSDARHGAGDRPGPAEARARAGPRRASRGARRPRAAPGTGPPPTASATSWRPPASSSRTRATASAGDAPRRPRWLSDRVPTGMTGRDRTVVGDRVPPGRPAQAVGKPRSGTARRRWTAPRTSPRLTVRAAPSDGKPPGRAPVRSTTGRSGRRRSPGARSDRPRGRDPPDTRPDARQGADQGAIRAPGTSAGLPTAAPRDRQAIGRPGSDRRGRVRTTSARQAPDRRRRDRRARAPAARPATGPPSRPPGRPVRAIATAPAAPVPTARPPTTGRCPVGTGASARRARARPDGRRRRRWTAAGIRAQRRWTPPLPPPEALGARRGAHRRPTAGRGGVRRRARGDPPAGDAGPREAPSRRSSCTPPACASRSSRSRAAA